MKDKRIDLSKVRTFDVAHRDSKMSADRMVLKPYTGASLREFLIHLPDQLGAKALRGIIYSVVQANKLKKAVVIGCGAHLIKLGLGPLLVELMNHKIINHIAANGAFFIHDWELANNGATSEDVGEALKQGTFGMATETALGMNRAVSDGFKLGLGAGESLAKRLIELSGSKQECSVMANALRNEISITAHIAIGAEIIHQHESFDGAAWGKASHDDFRELATSVGKMSNGGVYINIGSAVVMPEVFLKALSIAKNIDPKLGNFTTANIDMIRHYRPGVNVLARPHQLGGPSYEVIGQLEIILPMLVYGILEEMENPWTEEGS